MLLGIKKHWHVPLLVCRALSTAPAAWWGLRCALTFMGELLLDEVDRKRRGGIGMGLGMMGGGEVWSIEKRFRVTEVFLAVLWVGQFSLSQGKALWLSGRVH